MMSKPDQRCLHRQSTQGPQQVDRQVRPPGSGVPVPGANAGSSAVDVDADVEVIDAVHRLGDRVGEHGVEAAAVAPRRHEVPAHALLAPSSPTRPGRANSRGVRSGRSWMPGIAPLSMRRRIGVPWLARLPSMDVGGVGVGVEVHHAHGAEAVVVGDGGGRRPGDRVVAADRDRDDAEFEAIDRRPWP